MPVACSPGRDMTPEGFCWARSRARQQISIISPIRTTPIHRGSPTDNSARDAVLCCMFLRVISPGFVGDRILACASVGFSLTISLTNGSFASSPFQNTALRSVTEASRRRRVAGQCGNRDALVGAAQLAVADEFRRRRRRLLFVLFFTFSIDPIHRSRPPLHPPIPRPWPRLVSRRPEAERWMPCCAREETQKAELRLDLRHVIPSPARSLRRPPLTMI